MIFESLITRLPEYEIIRITRGNIERHIFQITELEAGNESFAKLSANYPVQESQVRSSILDHPPITKEDQKYYLCFYRQGRLVGLLDFLEGYEYQKRQGEACVWIGLLEIAADCHNQGVGQEILFAFEEGACEEGFQKIQLGVIQGNEPAQEFWNRAGFEEIAETDNGKYHLSVMEKRMR